MSHCVPRRPRPHRAQALRARNDLWVSCRDKNRIVPSRNVVERLEAFVINLLLDRSLWFCAVWNIMNWGNELWVRRCNRWFKIVWISIFDWFPVFHRGLNTWTNLVGSHLFDDVFLWSLFYFFQFQDQFELIGSHTSFGIEYVDKVAKFVKERIRIEAEYAKELRFVIRNGS